MKNKIFVLLTLSLLTACGGGGGSSSPLTPPVPVGPTVQPSTKPQGKLVIGTAAHNGSAQSVTRRNGLTFITVMDASPSPAPSGSPAPTPTPTPTPPPTIGITTVPTVMGINDAYVSKEYPIGPTGGYTELFTYLDGYADQIPNPMPNVTYQISGNAIQNSEVPSTTFLGYASNWFPQAEELNPSATTGATVIKASATVSGLNLTATQQVNTYNVLAITNRPGVSGFTNTLPIGLAFDVNGVAQPTSDTSQADIYINSTAVYFPYGADLYSDGNPVFETMTVAPEQNIFTSIPVDANEWEGTGGIMTTAHQHATFVFKTHDGRWVKMAPGYAVASVAFAGTNPNYVVMLSGPYRVSDYAGHFDI